MNKLIVIFVLVLVGCQPSQEAIECADAQQRAQEILDDDYALESIRMKDMVWAQRRIRMYCD